MLIVFLWSACGTPDPATLTLVVRTADPLPEADSVFVSGDHEVFGEWDPNSTMLEIQEDGSWSGEFPIGPGPVKFKITRGSWDSEAVTADGCVLPDQFVRVRSDTTVTMVIKGWKDVSHRTCGQITGTVRYYRGMEGDGIQARDVVIWLPPGYENDVERRYPVLYMHDGQNAVDPTTAAGSFDWQLDEHADSLSRMGLMPPILVVGVYNTRQRDAEYRDTEIGGAYLDWLADDLKKRVDADFRTLADRGNTATIGSSMGGLAAFLALWKRNDTFSAAASFSPFFPESLPEAVEASGWVGSESRLYIHNGGDQTDSFLQQGIDPVLTTLRGSGFADGENLRWVRDMSGMHHETSWSSGAVQALVFLFGGASGLPSDLPDDQPVGASR